MKFLVDVNLGNSVAAFFLSKGFDAKSVMEINASMPDDEILAIAVAEDRILVTIDKDFGELIYKQGLFHKGVIRLEDTTTGIKLHYLDKLLNEFPDQLQDNIIVVQNGLIRIRKK